MQGKERLAVLSAGVQRGQDQCCAVSDSDTCWEPRWGVAMARPELGPFCHLLD